MTAVGPDRAGPPLPARRPCPICGKAAMPARPFCSQRCADVDLHRWLAGVYALPLADGGDDADLG